MWTSDEEEEPARLAQARVPATRAELEQVCFILTPSPFQIELQEQALEKAQLQIGQLKSEKKLLNEKVDALMVELTALHGNKKSQKIAADIPYADVLKNLGKKFAIMQEPWLKPAVFQVPLVINTDVSPAARFTDDESYNQGTIAVLHEFVTVKYHDDMVNLSNFAKQASVALFLRMHC
jgi:hypothetical protein